MMNIINNTGLRCLKKRDFYRTRLPAPAMACTLWQVPALLTEDFSKVSISLNEGQTVKLFLSLKGTPEYLPPPVPQKRYPGIYKAFTTASRPFMMKQYKYIPL